MKVKGIGWLGTRTDKFEEMVKFAREVLGLPEPYLLKQRVAVFDLPNGDLFEIFGPNDEGHIFMTCPVGGFLVENVEEARRFMECTDMRTPCLYPLREGGNYNGQDSRPRNPWS